MSVPNSTSLLAKVRQIIERENLDSLKGLGISFTQKGLEDDDQKIQQLFAACLQMPQKEAGKAKQQNQHQSTIQRLREFIIPSLKEHSSMPGIKEVCEIYEQLQVVYGENCIMVYRRLATS